VWAGPKDGVIVKSGGVLWLVAVENGRARRYDARLHSDVYLIPEMGPKKTSFVRPFMFSKRKKSTIYNAQLCTKWPHIRTHF
jgi:hypothetical protein